LGLDPIRILSPVMDYLERLGRWCFRRDDVLRSRPTRARTGVPELTCRDHSGLPRSICMATRFPGIAILLSPMHGTPETSASTRCGGDRRSIRVAELVPEAHPGLLLH